MQEVLRNLVKRYVAAMIRDAKTEEGLTEENFKVGSENYFVYQIVILCWFLFYFHIDLRQKQAVSNYLLMFLPVLTYKYGLVLYTE